MDSAIFYKKSNFITNNLIKKIQIDTLYRNIQNSKIYIIKLIHKI